MDPDPTDAHPTTEVVEIRPTATGAGQDDWARFRHQAQLATEARARLQKPLSGLYRMTNLMKQTHTGELDARAIAIYVSQELPELMQELNDSWKALGEAVEEQDGEDGEQVLQALHDQLRRLGAFFDEQESVVDWLDRLSLPLARVALDVYEFRSFVDDALSAGWNETSNPRLPLVQWATARVNEG